MSEQGKPSPAEMSRQVILSQHPGIGGEIQGAINTLRKLQQITGTLGGENLVADTDQTMRMGAEAKGAAYAEVPLLKAGETFGRYQITRSLGCGAMGAVYLAYDSQLQRYIALKTPFLGKNRDVIERFYREARATSQLRSPYLCPIYDVGEISGIHYLSMAFIDGVPLEKAIAEGRYKDPQDAAKLVQKVARGLQKAHEQAVIHRDLKPENVMIDSDGEPIVMDFGLARRMDDDIQFTAPGRLLGTPAYMSPEQVDGDPSKIGPATDIYSLGVVLYKMLSGHLPFQGSLASVLHQIGTAEPARPSVANPTLGTDSPLEKICLKMMAKVPVDRPPTMAAVVESLDQIITKNTLGPLVEKEPSMAKRLWAWSRKVFHRGNGAATGTPTPAATPAPAPSPGKSHEMVASGSRTGGSGAKKTSTGDSSSGAGEKKTHHKTLADSKLGNQANRNAPASSQPINRTLEDSQQRARRGSGAGLPSNAARPDENSHTVNIPAEGTDAQGSAVAPPDVRHTARRDENLQTIDLSSGDSEEQGSVDLGAGKQAPPIRRDESLQTIDLSSGSEDEDGSVDLDPHEQARPIRRDESLQTIDLSSTDSEEPDLGEKSLQTTDLGRSEANDNSAGDSDADIRAGHAEVDESSQTRDLDPEESSEHVLPDSDSGAWTRPVDPDESLKTLDQAPLSAPSVRTASKVSTSTSAAMQDDADEELGTVDIQKS